jgi:hypothetical protein
MSTLETIHKYTSITNRGELKMKVNSKVTNTHFIDPTLLFLGIYPKVIRAYVRANADRRCSLAVFFVIATDYEQPEYLSRGFNK